MAPCSAVRDIHEKGRTHKTAMHFKDTPIQTLVECGGLSLSSEVGKNTKLGTNAELILEWIRNGYPGVIGSCFDLIHAVADAADSIVVQATCCKDDTEKHLCERGKPCCKQCLGVAGNTKLVNHARDWGERCDWISLTHCALHGSKSGQHKLANRMSRLYGIEVDKLKDMPYQQVLSRTRSFFVNIPYKTQNTGLRTLLSIKLDYLTPAIALGCCNEIAPQLACSL